MKSKIATSHRRNYCIALSGHFEQSSKLPYPANRYNDKYRFGMTFFIDRPNVLLDCERDVDREMAQRCAENSALIALPAVAANSFLR